MSFPVSQDSDSHDLRFCGNLPCEVSDLSGNCILDVSNFSEVWFANFQLLLVEETCFGFAPCITMFLRCPISWKSSGSRVCKVSGFSQITDFRYLRNVVCKVSGFEGHGFAKYWVEDIACERYPQHHKLKCSYYVSQI